MPASSRVLLLTRPGCHLCEDALAVVSSVCEEVGAAWRAVDVDSDETLRREWTDHVPVTFVDGRLHGRWFLDPERFREALAAAPAHPVPITWLPPSTTST